MIFQDFFRNKINTHSRPPVWMMRQAGRYQASYQSLKQKHTFNDFCLTPELASQIAINAVEEFDFDAAILFSDILYIVSALGPKLDFNPAPSFEYHLRELSDLKKYNIPNNIEEKMNFQYESLMLTRKNLNKDKGLIGFVGGLFTLYTFAVEGTTKKGIPQALNGMKTGLFEGFMGKITPCLLKNMSLQASADIDCMAIFDSSLHFMDKDCLNQIYLRKIIYLLKKFRETNPNTPILYYAKTSDMDFLKAVSQEVDCLGIDSSVDLNVAFDNFPCKIEGNFSPESLLLNHESFKVKFEEYISNVQNLKIEHQKKLITTLGHGILPNTPVENVKYFVENIKTINF